MPEAPIDIANFVSDDDELVFDEAEVPAMPAPVVSEEPEAPAKKSRRAPKKGSDTAAAEQALPETTPSAAPAEVAADEPADAPVSFPRTGTSAGSTSSEDPAPAKDRRQLLLGAGFALALVSSFASLGGLITVSRSLATANAARAQASEQAEALAKIGPIVAALDQASARLNAAAAKAPAPAGPAATLDDLHHAIDDLKLSMANSQPGGVAPLTSAVHDGFSDIADRLSQIDSEVQALSAPKGPAVVVTPARTARR